MPRRNAEAQKRTVSLHVGPSFPSAWEGIVLPWLQSVALASIESEEPVAVVTPFPGGAAVLRSKLLEHSVPVLGVKFLTPPQLRELLLANDATKLPLREHLRLLLAIAAEAVGTSNAADADLVAIAKSISRAPDNLLRVFDQIGAAGWKAETVGPPALQQIIKKFQDLVRKCDFQLVDDADRATVEAAKTAAPRFSHLLVTGFTAAHWSLWPLLQSAILSARRAEVVLEYPREQTRAADESWIGTWEESFGAAEPIPEQAKRAKPFADLIRPADATIDLPGSDKRHFLVGLNATEQAQAIYAIALKFLGEKSCTRLGILFPRGGAVPRLVAELFTGAGIPHNDGIGHFTPGEFESPAWNTWLVLQENHQLEPLLRFFEANPDSLDGLLVHEMRDILRRAYRDILIDDINVLREYCLRQRDDEKLIQVAKVLSEVNFLPTKADLETFLAQTKTIFTKLKWNDRWTAIEQFGREWSDKLSAEFSRATYLRWLKEILNSFVITRAPEGDHRYSRVHLLSYTDADQCEWSHLILAGLNQGEWPPGKNESGFLPDQQIANLNLRATRRGKQGEGHLVLEKGKTFLLSAQDERQIALRQFAAVLESVEHGLATTASLLQESAPERFWNPSELFSQIYFTTQRTPLSQDVMSILREETRRWLGDQPIFGSKAATPFAAAQTRVAYDVRRSETEFGQYEFALREPIKREITLRVTEWERAIKSPALVWLKKYLGVENDDPDLNQWSLATGIWIHDWLAKISDASADNTFVAFPPAAEICERIARPARAFRKFVADLCAACGRDVPDWWTSGWGNAFALADYLGSKLMDSTEWSHLAAEWRLQSPQLISLNGENKLRVRGRIDLILARVKPNDSRMADANIWIVDYKTGATKALTVSGKTPESRFEKLRKKLVDGDAVQLGLYGFAARELGAADVDLSILSQRTELDRPQLAIDTLAEQKEFWNELFRMQETGIFGLRGLIRNEFGFSPDYPLATLPIDKEFLDEKWVRTHPAFAVDEDDWS
jgi:hypothetical protein